MPKYRIEITVHGETTEVEDDFDSYADAEEHALYLIGCSHQGAEILHMSNPFENPSWDDEDDYDYDEDEFEITEISD